MLLQQRVEGRREFSETFDLVVFLAVARFDIVVELLYSEHVTVVGEGYAGHAVSHCLVHKPLYTGLPVENRILRVNMQMYEVVWLIGHLFFLWFLIISTCREFLLAGDVVFRLPYSKIKHFALNL